MVEVLKRGAEGGVEAPGGGAALLEPGQDLGGAEGEVEVQVVPRQCPVGLESRPAERLPASLAQKQRSPPAQSLEESPQRQGQQRLTACAHAPAPIPAARAQAAPASRAALAPVAPASHAAPALGPAAPGALAPAGPAAHAPAAPARAHAPAAPAPGAHAPPARAPPARAPAPFVVVALAAAFFEFPILLVMGHFELGQAVENFV